jgi:hypothetical protein
MNGLGHEPEVVRTPDHGVSSDRQSHLLEVIADLEANLVKLEQLDLTLAVALLDHAIAEVRKQAAIKQL